MNEHMEWNNLTENYFTNTDGEKIPSLTLICNEKDGLYTFKVLNTSDEPVTVGKAILFEGSHGMHPDTPVYAEGMQMLSQYEGKLSEIKNISVFSDRDHYKFDQTEGFTTVYNMMLTRTGNEHTLIGFASCRRFNGQILFNLQKLRVQLDIEGIVIEGGETVELEQVYFAKGTDSTALLDKLGDLLIKNHPPLPLSHIPSGWCSWYAYGPHITEKIIADNMSVMVSDLPMLRYVQIDDGYQAHWGDWLENNPSYGDVRESIKAIHKTGLDPAIWVAPFVADADSSVLREHPEWFIKDEGGNPLSSQEFTFPGWRNAPWYMLDGTNDDVLAHLKKVFSIIRNEWGVKYFKLDSLMWGAFAKGVRKNPKMTSVEAYRAGMEALIDGAGSDAVILGGNNPLWPSIGVINAFRCSNDLSRDWKNILRQQREIMRRNWMHKKLWYTDPDTFTLQNISSKQVLPDGTVLEEQNSSLTEHELGFHRALIFASAGLTLSGDDMTRYDENDKKLVGKLIPPRESCAIFTDDSFSVGIIHGNPTFICLFNTDDFEKEMSAEVDREYSVSDYWTDEPLGCMNGCISAKVPPHGARVLRLDNVCS